VFVYPQIGSLLIIESKVKTLKSIPFRDIFCVVKTSEYTHHNSTEERARRFKRLSQATQEQITLSQKNQIHFLEQLQESALEINLEIQFVSEKTMNSISPGVNDLVISCGGDGTFLSCAQKYQTSALLGMNSDYQHKPGSGSYGALTSTNYLNLKQNLRNLKDQQFSIFTWNRLQASINGTLVERYAVNDIYFGQKIAYQTCDLRIAQTGIYEEFSCSGVLCCTGMGSHAWYYNAGGSPFSNELDAFGFQVLFPNLKRPLRFTSGIVASRYDLLIIPERDHYILSYDSKSNVIETFLGDEIRLFLAPENAVRVVSF